MPVMGIVGIAGVLAGYTVGFILGVITGRRH